MLFWVPYGGEVYLHDGTQLGHGGFVYMLKDVSEWIVTTGGSVQYINDRNRRA